MAIIKGGGTNYLTDLMKNFKFDDLDLMKDLYQPTLTKQIFDHQVDAMVFALNGSRNQHDRQAEEKRLENMRDVYRYHGQYIDPERPHSAFQRLFVPDYVDKFLWGPRGEFTGIVKDADAHRQFQSSPTGKWRQERFTLHMKMALIPYEDELVEWGDPRFYQCFGGGSHVNFGAGSGYNHQTGHHVIAQLVQFENYRDLVEYHSFINQDHGRERGYTELCHELAGLLQNIRPQRSALLEWMDALKNTKATFGFGCLHDGEGSMDPLGVLAEANACDWVWEKKEGAYKIKGGDAYSLPDSALRSYLMIPDDTLPRHVQDFQTRFPQIMDRYTTFEQVNADLQNALDLITWRLNDVRRMRNSMNEIDMPTIGGGGLGVYDGDSLESPMARRWDILPERQRDRYIDVIRPDRISRFTKMDWT